MKVEEALEYIKRGYDSERMAQAYIVTGAVRGSGRRLVDDILQMLFCKEENSPCGACRECRQVLDHTCPDLQWVEPEKKSRIISVAQVRGLQQKIFQTSFSGGWKACVLVAADRMGDEASNAFLKTLEEPPAKTLFLLLTDSPQNMLTTIKSRCQQVAVADDGDGLRPEWEVRLVEMLTESSLGSVSIALGKGESLGLLLKDIKDEAMAEVMEAMPDEKGDEKKEIIEARASARFLEMRADIMRYILEWYRDVLVVVCGSDEDVLCNQGHKDAVVKLASKLNYRQAYRNLAMVESMNKQLERNVGDKSVLSFGFSRMY